MHNVALVLTLLTIGLMGYAGYKNGAFFSAYGLMRNLFGFLMAMTLFEHLGSLLAKIFPSYHPLPLYYEAIGFVALFSAVFVLARSLKVRFTPANVPAVYLADRIGGTFLGTLNGILMAGLLLIMWSLMPYAKYLPGDFGRVDPQRLPVDAGGIVLRFYSFTAGRMPGSKMFLLEDEPFKDEDRDGRPDASRDLDYDGIPDHVPGEDFTDLNNNGQWDRGWLWRYRTFADLRMEDIKLTTGPRTGPR